MRIRRSVKLAICIVCFVSFPIFGQSRASLKLDREALTVLGLTIGSSTSAEVERKLGRSRTFKASGSSGASDVRCYRSASPGDDTVVTFYFGALGGWIDLTKVAISTKKASPVNASWCTQNGEVSRNLEFLKGLTLGASPADVVHILGSPSRRSKNGLTYYVSRPCSNQGMKAGTTPPGSCVIVDSVRTRFEDGLVYASFYQFTDQ